MTNVADLAQGLARWQAAPAGVARQLAAPLTAVARQARGAGSWVLGEADRLTGLLISLAVRRVLDQLDLTALVHERVDLDAVAKDIDVDAIVERVDIDRIIDRVDIDAVVARVDIQRIIDRVDVDAVVARVDIEQIIDRVDIDSVATRVDVDAIVARLDLIGLANDVVEGIDLPGIVRESSGMMASETLSGVRLQSLQADEALARAVSRWIPRRRTNHSAAVAEGTEPREAP